MEKKSIKYTLRSLDLVQFATFDDSYTNDNNNLELTTRFSFRYNFAQNIVLCSNTIIYKQNGNPLIKADLDAYYNLIDTHNIMTEEGVIELPEGFQAKLASFTYDTLRGIIFAKTLNTPLNKVLLPLKDVQPMFDLPAVFRNEQLAKQ